MPDWDAVETLTRQLELCKVSGNEAVVVLIADDTDRGLLEVTLTALACLEVRPTTVQTAGEHLPHRRPAEAAAEAATFVVDLTGGALRDALSAPTRGLATRILAVRARTPAEVRQLVPHPGLVRRAENGRSLLEAGGTLQLTSASGNNLTIGLQHGDCWGTAGVAAEPGDSANWPRGDIGVALQRAPGAKGAASGKLVLEPGDVLLPFGSYVRSPATITFAGGNLVDMRGEITELGPLKALLESPASQQVSRLGVGLLHMRGRSTPARFEPGFATSPQAAMTQGHVVLCTGTTNPFSPSSRDEGVGFCLRWSTLAVDEEAVVRDGQLVGVLTPDMYEQAAQGTPG